MTTPPAAAADQPQPDAWSDGRTLQIEESTPKPDGQNPPPTWLSDEMLLDVEMAASIAEALHARLSRGLDIGALPAIIGPVVAAIMRKEALAS